VGKVLSLYFVLLCHTAMQRVILALAPLSALAAAGSGAQSMGAASTCGDMKEAYRAESCCGNPSKVTNFQVVPMPKMTMFQNNICHGKKPTDGHKAGDNYFKNINCSLETGVVQALEQSGRNVTKGHQGGIDATSRPPITTPYYEAGLCAVNVHWHIGAEHLSEGEYDATGTGPTVTHAYREGFRCKKYNANDAKFTKPYDWKHCVNMHVGQTYEVHWPHSAAGACNTPYQFQTPFYDGVFCKDGIVSLNPLNTFQKIGVQGQVFTIVNDETYYYPDLMRGAIVDGDYWKDVAKYTGSTTGTTRNNEICSRYTPITWQVDRKCHLISASSFDKMCADMKAQVDDMTHDLHAHGSREVVDDKLASNNHQRL